MADTAAEVVAPAVATKSPKKAVAKKPRGAAKPKVKSDHPPTADMVKKAIVELKERKGSSLQAIKKYIAAHYKVDVEKQAIFIRKYVASAAEKGILTRTKGTGATGSFKIAEKAKVAEKKAAKKPASKKPAVKKPAAAKKPKATVGAVKKVSAVVKKPAVAAKKPAAKPKVAKPAAVKKSPSKAKKGGKAPTAKPKSPRAKKAAVKPRAAAKK